MSPKKLEQTTEEEAGRSLGGRVRSSLHRDGGKTEYGGAGERRWFNKDGGISVIIGHFVKSIFWVDSCLIRIEIVDI